MRRRRSKTTGTWFICGACLGASACGSTSSQVPSGTSPPEGRVPAQPDEKSPEQELPSEEELMRQIAEQEQLADAEVHANKEETSAEAEQPYRREIVYRVGLNGMRIQLEGAEFQPRAETVAVRGGTGVKLTVQASANLDLSLLNPKNGPLAFGGTVRREQVEKFGDRRQGESELKLSPGRPVTFSRTWPGPDQKPLAPHEELTLQVGLWGLGPTAEDRRPIKRFFVVKLSGDPKSSPSVEPASQ